MSVYIVLIEVLLRLLFTEDEREHFLELFTFVKTFYGVSKKWLYEGKLILEQVFDELKVSTIEVIEDPCVKELKLLDFFHGNLWAITKYVLDLFVSWIR